MTHWCLTDVDYKQLNFFARPLPERPKGRSRNHGSTASSVSSGGTAGDTTPSSPRSPAPSASPRSPRSPMDSPRASPFTVAKGNYDGTSIQFRIAPSRPLANESAPQTPVEWAQDNLRAALLSPDRHADIPRLIANWPTPNLTLWKVLSPEACERCLGNMDQLWGMFLQGVLLLGPHSHLADIDLTRFVPSNTMVYTMLQLVPFLCLPAVINKNDIYDLIVTAFGIHDSGMLQNLSGFLDRVLRHPAFHRGRRVHLPAGQLTLTLDQTPLSTDRLSLLCWLAAAGIEPVTGVTVRLRTVCYRYREASGDLCPVDPLLPLRCLPLYHLCTDVEGVSVEEVPAAHLSHVLSSLLPAVTTRCHSLTKLALSFCNIDLKADPVLERSLVGCLKSLTALSRLDMSGTTFAGSLDGVLGAVDCQLEFLNLTQCCLLASDLEYLVRSKHSRTLRDLNLSNCYSDECADCKNPWTSPLVQAMGKLSPRSPPPPGERCLVSPGWSETSSEPPDCVSPTGGGDSWAFWLSQRSISSPTADVTPQHEDDHHLLLFIFNNLSCFTNLTIFDVNCDKLGSFRVPGWLLEPLLQILPLLPGLKRLDLSGMPLWDDDIVQVVEVVARLTCMQCLVLSRAPEAPSLSVSDRFNFWRRVDTAKHGKALRLSVENFVDEELNKLLDADDDNGPHFSTQTSSMGM